MLIFLFQFLFAATIEGIINTVTNSILMPFITVLILLATVVFMWGIIKFIAAAGDSKKAAEGKQLMFWGIIGLFVIVAMWGLVAVIQNTFSLTPSELPRQGIPKPGDIPPTGSINI
jgi:protein-S-isoprenylcysteine O-methyltransferase Ste14